MNTILRGMGWAVLGGLALQATAEAQVVLVRGGLDVQDFGAQTMADPSGPLSSLHQAVAAAQAGDVIEMRGAMTFDFYRDSGLRLTKNNLTIRGIPAADTTLPVIRHYGNYAYNTFNIAADGIRLEGFRYEAPGENNSTEDNTAVHQNFVGIGSPNDADPSASYKNLTIAHMEIRGARCVINTMDWIDGLTFSHNTIQQAALGFGKANPTWNDPELDADWYRDVKINGVSANTMPDKRNIGYFRGGEFKGSTLIEHNIFAHVGEWAGEIDIRQGAGNPVYEWQFPIIEIEKNVGEMIIQNNTFTGNGGEYAVRGDHPMDGTLTLHSNGLLLINGGGTEPRPVQKVLLRDINGFPNGYGFGFYAENNQIIVVPEPMSMLALALGAVVLVGRRETR